MNNKQRTQEIRDDAVGLAANLVDDFSENDPSKEPLPKVLQINVIAAEIENLILKYAQPSKATK